MKPAELPLAPVHLPPEPPWWPPAPGWWVLAALLLLLLGVLLRWLLQAWRRRRLRRRVLADLAALAAEPDPVRRLIALNVLLRRVALAAHDRREVAALQGPAWLEFLERTGGPGFRDGPGRVLADGPYRVRVDYDWPALEALARSWIRRNLGVGS